MGRSIKLLDFEDAAEDIERWIVQFGLPRGLPPDAEFIVEVNWASSGSGIDWPEAYFIAPDASAEYWVLWARNEDDPFLAGHDTYPIAWCESDLPLAEAALDLLGMFWQSMRDRYEWRRFELGMRFGLLDRSKTDSVAGVVWGNV